MMVQVHIFDDKLPTHEHNNNNNYSNDTRYKNNNYNTCNNNNVSIISVININYYGRSEEVRWNNIVVVKFLNVITLLAKNNRE